MAKAFQTKWKGGKCQLLSPGYHYNTRCGCLIVPTGEQVTLYQNQDRTGFKSMTFYEGEYMDMDFYQDFITSKDADIKTLQGLPSLIKSGNTKKPFGRTPGVIHVEKNDLRPQDFLTAWWKTDGRWHYKQVVKIPVGDRKAFEDFPNDVIDHLEIPFGMTVEVFADGFDKGSLIFSGNHEGDLTHIDLSEFDYNDKISNMKVTADDWELAGIALENGTLIESKEERRAVTIELHNNAKDGEPAVMRQLVSTQFAEETSEDWGIGGSVTVSASVMGGYEAAGAKVEVTAGMEVEVHADYGQSKTTSKEIGLESEVSVPVDPMSSRKASLIVEVGKMDFDAVRKWRNKRTGAIIEEKGHLRSNKAGQTRIEVH